METNKIEITQGPSKDDMTSLYRNNSQKNVRFDVFYETTRILFADIIEIISVQETLVKMLASVPLGFFMYSQGEDSGLNSEKTCKIQVCIFYTPNTGKGYIEKIARSTENEEQERVCPRCKGSKVDPHHFQDDCQRCGGVGKVYGDESKWTPYPFLD